MIVVGQDGYFDDKAIRAMALAYDRACCSLRSAGTESMVQETVAKLVIEFAAQGERDPDRLHDQALTALGIEETQKTIAA